VGCNVSSFSTNEDRVG